MESIKEKLTDIQANAASIILDVQREVDVRVRSGHRYIDSSQHRIEQLAIMVRDLAAIIENLQDDGK